MIRYETLFWLFYFDIIGKSEIDVEDIVKGTFIRLFAAFDTHRHKDRVLYVRYCGVCPLFMLDAKIKKIKLSDGRVYPIVTNELIRYFFIRPGEMISLSIRTPGFVDRTASSIIRGVISNMASMSLNEILKLVDEVFLGGTGSILDSSKKTLDVMLSEALSRTSQLEAVNVCAQYCVVVPHVPNPSADFGEVYLVSAGLNLVDALVSAPTRYTADVIREVLKRRPDVLAEILANPDAEPFTDSVKMSKESLPELYSLYSNDEYYKEQRERFMRLVEEMKRDKGMSLLMSDVMLKESNLILDAVRNVINIVDSYKGRQIFKELSSTARGSKSDNKKKGKR
ncbi:MAG: hypothetical protein ABGW50_02060 [Thermococcus sp.]